MALLDVDGALFPQIFVRRNASPSSTLTACHAGRAATGRSAVLQTHHPATSPAANVTRIKAMMRLRSRRWRNGKRLQLPPWTSHVIIRAEDHNNQQAPVFQQLRNSDSGQPAIRRCCGILGPVPPSRQTRRPLSLAIILLRASFTDLRLRNTSSAARWR